VAKDFAVFLLDGKKEKKTETKHNYKRKITDVSC